MKAALPALIALALAGSAQAQTAEDLMAAPLRVTSRGVGVDLASPRVSFVPRYAHAGAPRIPGVARTAVDRRLEEGAIASLGFLCGLEPGQERTGPTSARGYDPTGRFVGAKLRLAFR